MSCLSLLFIRAVLHGVGPFLFDAFVDELLFVCWKCCELPRDNLSLDVPDILLLLLQLLVVFVLCVLVVLADEEFKSPKSNILL